MPQEVDLPSIQPIPRATRDFLDAFNAIDALLRKSTKAHRGVPFVKVLLQAREKDPSLVPITDRLELFNQLRNIIVHNGTDLAEPVRSTLKAIQRIRERLEAPALLAPAFIRETVSCRPTDPLRNVARLMATEDFSQLPVYDSGGLLKGVITTAAVARWLGTHADGSMAELDTPISTVMKYEEYPRSYRVFRTTDTVAQALAAFKGSSDRGDPLYAIILTEGGRHNSPPRGVITLFDMPRLWTASVGG